MRYLCELLNEVIYEKNMLFHEFFMFWDVANKDEGDIMERLLSKDDRGLAAIKYLEKILKKYGKIERGFFPQNGIDDDESLSLIRSGRTDARLRKNMRKRMELQKIINSFKVDDIVDPARFESMSLSDREKYVSKIKHIANAIGITNIDKYDMNEIVIGLDVEKEHLNVVKTVPDIMKIALAHLDEKKNYYSLLLKYVD